MVDKLKLLLYNTVDVVCSRPSLNETNVALPKNLIFQSTAPLNCIQRRPVMNFLALRSRCVKITLANLIFGLLFFSSVLTINAQTTTFAQFFERNGTQDFVFTNNTSSANFDAVGGGSSIFFIYSNIASLDPSLQGVQNAHLFITTTTTQPATNNAGTFTQPFDQTVTVQIIRDTPAPSGVGTGTRTHLLTAIFSPIGASQPAIVGSGNSATFSATTPDHVVTFSSDFLRFGLTTQRNLAFSYSSVTPGLALGGGSFLQSFTAAATGTFASNPPPIYAIPTAASVSVSGRVLTPNGRGLQNAQVTLTDANGTVHNAVTSSFGYYRFNEIESGQSVIISINSKRYRFNTQVVSVQDNISDMDFYGSEF